MREDRKPASVSIAGFFFETQKMAKKAHRNKRGGLKSILWEGGGDRDNYRQFQPLNKIPICNTYYAFRE
jgi:hypothetical protein